MKKIPTLFVRKFEGHKMVECTPDVTPGLEWVLEDPGVIATVKFDGSCCALMADNRGNLELWKRYDAKPGRKIPEGAKACCDPDPVTGHWPHWVKCDPTNPADKWFYEALHDYMMYTRRIGEKPRPATYEAVGLHFNGNPYELTNDYLVEHGDTVIKDLPIGYESIKRWLEEHDEEGIVFWYDGDPICKIKRSDFGLPWPARR